MTRGRRREHYQWNMDIFGVPKVRAEAELLQSIVLLFERLGITSSVVGIRVSSRKVLQAVLNMYSIPEHLFTEVCVIVDELGKQTREEIEKELISTGLSSEAVQGIIEVLSLKSLSKLEEVLGSGVEAVADLKKLFSFAEQYGYADWICFNASVVRGLAYYTGIVFEMSFRDALKEVLSTNMFSSRQNGMQAEIVAGGQGMEREFNNCMAHIPEEVVAHEKVEKLITDAVYNKFDKRKTYLQYVSKKLEAARCIGSIPSA